MIDKATTPDEGFVRLSAARPLHGDPERVVELVADGAAPWDGEPVDGAPPGLRRYAVDLRLRVGGNRNRLTTFRKAAWVDLGHPRRSDGRWTVEIGWRASTAAPLFPVFSGHLVIGPDDLRIEGLYAPPGGMVGIVADRMLLHVAANGTARWLLDELDRTALGAAG